MPRSSAGLAAFRMLYCTVEGCSKHQFSTGLCSRHYKQKRLTGSALTPFKRPEKGSGQKWFDAHVGWKEKDECLIWPFGVNEFGYAMSGKHRRMYREMCQAVNGPPPSAEHEAAHECGNGHLGCINPNHLSWKTHQQNADDRVAHGRQHRGTLTPNSKLTEVAVLEIRKSKPHTKETALLAEKFGICTQQVNAVRSRRAWAWLN